MDSLNREMLLRTVAGLGLHNGLEILELEIGNNGQLEQLMEMRPHIIYLDKDASHLEEPNDRTEKWVQLSDGFPAFNDRTYDRIVCINTIHFWKRPKDLMGQLYRVLKDGGLIAIGFVQGSILERLPADGYKPYDIPKLLRLFGVFPFKSIDIANHMIKIKGTDGTGISTDYTVLTLEK
ncbi:MAG: methyltransferase domain-containing protein [Sediminicola sp.]